MAKRRVTAGKTTDRPSKQPGSAPVLHETVLPQRNKKRARVGPVDPSGPEAASHGPSFQRAHPPEEGHSLWYPGIPCTCAPRSSTPMEKEPPRNVPGKLRFGRRLSLRTRVRYFHTYGNLVRIDHYRLVLVRHCRQVHLSAYNWCPPLWAHIAGNKLGNLPAIVACAPRRLDLEREFSWQAGRSC